MMNKNVIIELYDWQHGGTSFTSQLFTLFQKADPINKARLGIGFPEQFEALKLWEKAGDYGNDLFREYGLIE